MGTALNNLVPNPFLRPGADRNALGADRDAGAAAAAFPRSTPGVSEAANVFDSTYHALQMKVEKRFSQGGTVLASYTFSKLLADVSSLTGWLDSGVGSGPSIQNPYNLRAEKSLSGFDSRQRLTVSYAVDLPFGPGHKFLSGGNGLEKKVVGGWSVSGIATFQDGFPLALTATGTANGPLATAGAPMWWPAATSETSGSAQSRLNGWFNVSCFTVPAAYTLGNESATDPRASRARASPITTSPWRRRRRSRRRFNLEFRAEVFNSSTGFSSDFRIPSITTAANPTTGYHHDADQSAETDSACAATGVLIPVRLYKKGTPRGRALFFASWLSVTTLLATGPLACARGSVAVSNLIHKD